MVHIIIINTAFRPGIFVFSRFFGRLQINYFAVDAERCDAMAQQTVENCVMCMIAKKIKK
jgi:hypothetical protein